MQVFIVLSKGGRGGNGFLSVARYTHISLSLANSKAPNIVAVFLHIPRVPLLRRSYHECYLMTISFFSPSLTLSLSLTHSLALCLTYLDYASRYFAPSVTLWLSLARDKSHRRTAISRVAYTISPLHPPAQPAQCFVASYLKIFTSTCTASPYIHDI